MVGGAFADAALVALADVPAVPAPLAIGRVQFDTGNWVSGFVCEPRALEGATDITTFGGWRRYRAASAAPARETAH